MVFIDINISVDFGLVAVDEVAQKPIYIPNVTEKSQKYQVSYLYAVNNIDNVFDATVESEEVQPGRECNITIIFKPKIPGHSHIEYFLIDDESNNTRKLIVRGTCLGPKVFLKETKMFFEVCKNVSEERTKIVEIVNSSSMDTVFQWFVPNSGLGYFQVVAEKCGLIRAGECVSTSITYTATSTGSFTAELTCLVQHQEPLFLDVFGTYTLPGNVMLKSLDYLSERHRKRSPWNRLMENFLFFLPYAPSASASDRFLDFGTGNVNDISANISQTFCVTNHEDKEGYCQWIPDPERIFIIDPMGACISPRSSKLFTVRFRPKMPKQSFGYLLCGFFQLDKLHGEKTKYYNTWFRIPCTGNTWGVCEEIKSQWDCPTKIIMPPTVPSRVAFTNLTLSNKLDSDMLFQFLPPKGTNFTMMPMCGNLPGRCWQIVTVALEPKCSGFYCEHWELLINRAQKMRITIDGSAEESHIQVMSQGYGPSTHGMLVFPATITNCCSDAVSFLHNMTRNSIHLRVLNSVSWLGGDNGGSIILQPNEIVPYHWWFYPKMPDMVYETTVTCTCLSIIENKPVGEPREIFINISGFSEYPKLKVLPKTLNLHDIVVGDTVPFDLMIYNFGTCSLTFNLLIRLNGMGDDHSQEQITLSPKVNSLQPSKHCEVTGAVTPQGAGPREISVLFCVLYHSENKHLVTLKPQEKRICTIWYDGIYPSVQVKRAISLINCMALSGHCLWNIMNLDELNKALVECRPNKPLTVELYAPDLHVGAESAEVILVLDCVYQVPVSWSLKRHKLCECEMVEVQVGISTYEMRHSCVHRPVVEFTPMNGNVTPDNPALIHLTFAYNLKGTNVLAYILSLPNDRSLLLRFTVTANAPQKGILIALRRPIGEENYLAKMDCGRVPINNLDPVLRIVWLYNPTNVFATWRLLRNKEQTTSAIRCTMLFAEVPPLSRLSIPIAFLPTEMIEYEEVFACSFGFDIVKILVKGQGSLPECLETRLDVPRYMKNVIRAMHRKNVVWLSHEHLNIPVMPTHSLTRELIALNNDTNNLIRFIWLPVSIANIISICMTPSWGTLQPKTTQWITMTVYSLQEPATFTISIVCELFDLTSSREYQRNELLRRNKTELCAQQFIITEEGTTYPDINDFPPYVLDLPMPTTFYLTLSVAISTKGQRDGCRRMCLRQILEQAPPYDLLTSDGGGDEYCGADRIRTTRMPLTDIRIISALHSKMMKCQLRFYSKEEIPTYSQLMETLHSEEKPQLSKRITAGVCDALVNQAVFDVYSLKPKHHVEILRI